MTGETDRGFGGCKLRMNMVDSRWRNRSSGPGGEMNFRGYGHCSEYPDIFPMDRFDVGWSILTRNWTDADQDRPGWFGHDLSEIPDSRIGCTQNIRTCRNRVGWCDQFAFQPTIPQPIGRKRRAGDRVVTGSDVGRDVRREGALWGTLRKRALFGPEGQNRVSSGSDVLEAQSGWPPDDEYPDVAQSGWPPEDEYLEETLSPRVETG